MFSSNFNNLYMADFLPKINRNIKKPVRKNPVPITPKIIDDYYYANLKELTNKKKEENTQNEKCPEINGNEKIDKKQEENIQNEKCPEIDEKKIIDTKQEENIQNEKCPEIAENRLNIIPKNIFDAYDDKISKIGKVEGDLIETKIPCKPMININSSKFYMKKYCKKKNSIPENDEEEDSSDNSLEIEKWEPRLDDKYTLLAERKSSNKKKMIQNKDAKNVADNSKPDKFIKKKKKVGISSRNKYCDKISLHNSNKRIKFDLFKDKDRGFNDLWIKCLPEYPNDKDAISDEEDKEVAKQYCLDELEEGIKIIKEAGLKNVINNAKYWK